MVFTNLLPFEHQRKTVKKLAVLEDLRRNSQLWQWLQEGRRKTMLGVGTQVYVILNELGHAGSRERIPTSLSIYLSRGPP